MVNALGPQSLKGVATPMLVYRVLRESAVQSRLDVATTGLTPLVDREVEVVLLLERWAQSSEGKGQVVLLSGEAGIGKSRLVEVLREYVRRGGTRPIMCRCSPYHTASALYPVIERLKRLLPWPRDEAPQTKLDMVEQVQRTYRFPLQKIVPLVAALLGVPLLDRYPPASLAPQRQRQQTLEVLVAWLLAEAERQPVLAVWEDLHWADSSTLELLTHHRPGPHGQYAHPADLSPGVSPAVGHARAPDAAYPQPLESPSGRGDDRAADSWQGVVRRGGAANAGQD